MSYTVAGLDLSLTAAGIAIINQSLPAPMHEYTVRTVGEGGSNSDTLMQRLDRISRTAEQILVEVDSCDDVALVAIESPAYAKTTGKSHDRSGLWWEVIRLLTLNGTPVVEVTPSVVKVYGTGKGNSAKQKVLLDTVRRYTRVDISNDNEADAWLLACIAARLIGEPIDDLPKTHLRALETLHLPERFELS